MASKKLINSVESCVDECLEGLVAINPGLRILNGHRVVIRADIDDVKKAGKVTLLSGGGSGHEPAHAGYVGPGMLSGAIAGSVFTSPPPSSILAALRAVGKGNPAGTMMIIKNYTGDRLNFGLAAERAKAEGIKVEMVVVAEDCALTSSDRTAGRRGLCGTVLIHKIAGNLAEEGKSLEEIVKITTQATQSMGTMGVSLYPCSLPGQKPAFQLPDNSIEFGLGIHGEPGVKRQNMMSAKETVKAIIDHMTNPDTSTHINLKADDHVALMVNNLGGTSELEMSIVARQAIGHLESSGIHVDRAYCGSFMTSLEMAGISLTLLHLDETKERCLDAPTSAPGWSNPLLAKGMKNRLTPKLMPYDESGDKISSNENAATVSPEIAAMIHKAISYASEALGNCEEMLNKLDSTAGDGDCGSTLKRGTKAILEQLSRGEGSGLPVSCPSNLMLSLARICETAMGGSSGALYSLFFTAAATPLSISTSVSSWMAALKAGNDAIMRYAYAKPGYRTMLDPLCAAQKAFESVPAPLPLHSLNLAAQAAEKAAIATAKMAAAAGRSSYVNPELLTDPDPGAHAVGIWLRAVYEACKLMSTK